MKKRQSNETPSTIINSGARPSEKFKIPLITMVTLLICCFIVNSGMTVLQKNNLPKTKESLNNILLADEANTTVAQLHNGELITFKSKRMPDGKIWMTENLNTAYVAGSWCYNNKRANCEKNGRLYSWKAAQTACPKGWHLPSDEEWKKLALSIGGLSFWFPKPSTIDSPEAAFNFLQRESNLAFAGIYYVGSNGKDQSIIGNYWTSTSSNSSDAFYYGLSKKSGKIFRSYALKGDGRSCLCVKN